MPHTRKYPVTMHHGSRIRHLGPDGPYAADFTAYGEQARKRFKSLPAAKIWLDQKRTEAINKGRQAFGLSDNDRLALQDARKWIPVDVALVDVFEFWRTHHPVAAAVNIEALVDAFLTAPGRRGSKVVTRRAHTTEGHRKRLSSFVKTFGDRGAHEVTEADISTWLDVNHWTGLNLRHYLAAVRALFAFGIRKGHVGMNPASGIESPHVDNGDPEIMPVADVGRYLAAIDAECPDLLPREVLAFFCGLRPEELSRLEWRHVSLENGMVTIAGDVAKVQGQRRIVTIPANAAAWLLPHAQGAGPVWPYASATTLVRKRAIARKAAGVDVPGNAGRHCFASYHVALHGNEALTAKEMGHRDATLLRNVYRNITTTAGGPITEADGRAYFEILPPSEAGVIRFPGAKAG